MPVAFTSAGYGGAVTQESWSELSAHLGHHYTVAYPESWAVTPATGDRAISIGPGVGIGHGVRDVTSEAEPMFLPAVTSGTTRYDLVVVRRNWSTKTSSFAIIPGGTTRSLPARVVEPGFIDEQPIALVRVNANSTLIGEIVDLRVWGTNGGAVAVSELVRTFLDHPGSRVKIAGEIWSYEKIGADMWDWVNEDGSSPWVDLVFLPGWQRVGGGAQPRARLTGRGAFVHVQCEAIYPTGQPVEGWVICRLPGGMQPKEATYVAGTTDNYRRAGVYVIQGDAVRLGPAPVGNVVQLAGLAPLK
jgi:hypothetical protein